MAVKIRLQRHGSKKRPFYFIVVADTSAPRDGRFIEKLGTYNPLSVPATVRLNRDRALHWLQEGAQPTNTCRRILSFKGVLYMKHLLRGVSLGLFDENAAMEKFEAWNADHEKLVAERDEAHRKAKADKRNAAVAESVKKVEEKMAAKAAAAQPDEEASEEAASADEEATTEENVEATEDTAPVAEEATESTEEKKED